jgi:hypothetical protein
MRLLRHGAAPEGSPFTHKQIAEWCDRFWCQYLDSDAPADIEPLLPLLTEVETQWDLYLANTYSVKELQTSDFENAVLPTAWFEEWLTRAQVAP